MSYKDELFERIRKTIKIEINQHEFMDLINEIIRLEFEEKLKELQKKDTSQNKSVPGDRK